MALRKKAKAASRASGGRAKQAKARGSWFELIVLIFMLGAFYTIGALLDSSWTGTQGRLIGRYLREAWGGAILVPLLFLVYLCAAWFAKGRIPRPLGQIIGTLQLYLTTAFMLGLAKKTGLSLPWLGAEPGRLGTGLAEFFMLNLGALGTIITAFASLALASVFFGFKLPVYVLHRAASRLMEKKERKTEENEQPSASVPDVIIKTVPSFNADNPLPAEPDIADKTDKPDTSPIPIDVTVTAATAEPPPEFVVSSVSVEEPLNKWDSQGAMPLERGVGQSPAKTAVEILDELLASLEAESPLIGTTETPQAQTEEPVTVFSSASSAEPQIPVSSAETPVLPPPPPPVKEVRSPDWLNGIASAVQETFPEVSLPRDDGSFHLREGLFPPPLDIFGPASQHEEQDDGRELAEQQAVAIVETLKNFGIKAGVAHIVIGPSVIQFQLELAPGIKVSKVSGLANDLTMALAVISVRVEAPILGQRYVGIEIPNPKRKGITLRAIMESEEFQSRDCILPLPMGVRVDSKHLVCGLEDMPHLLVAGTTGSGKSVFMNACILGMCSQISPEDLKLILVDPKHVEFAIYEGLPHLLARPVSDPKKAISALSWAVQEMEARSEAFAKTKVRNLASYNEKVLPKSRFPHIVVVVDELADLMYTAGKEVEGLIARLAQKARAAGIHLILATQRPSVDVITGLIKANVPARVAFAVPSQTDSRTIIDTGGAEKLLGKGDMLFYSTRYPRPLRLQAAFITEERTLEFVEYMKNAFGEPDYIEFDDFSGGGNGGSNGERSGGSIADDPKMEEAIKIIMDTGIASASGLQRHLNIGYPRAGRLISGLEQLGIVGPQTSGSSKPRDILTDEEGALDILERARNGED